MKKALSLLLLLAVFGAVVAALLAWRLPAGIAWQHAGSRLAPLELEGISGTVWHGEAARAVLLGHDLGRLQWSTEAAPLLQQRLVTQLRLESADGVALGTRAEQAGGALRFDNLRLRLPAALAGQALAAEGLVARGEIDLQADGLRLLRGRPVAGTGRATWRDAALAGAASVALPDVHARFTVTPEGVLEGELDSAPTGGDISLSGTFRARIGKLEADLVLRPRREDPALVAGLDRIARRQADGSWRLRVEQRHGPL